MGIDKILDEDEPGIWEIDVSKFSCHYGQRLEEDALPLHFEHRYTRYVLAARIFEYIGKTTDNPNKLKHAAVAYRNAAVAVLISKKLDQALKCNVIAYFLFQRVISESEKPESEFIPNIKELNDKILDLFKNCEPEQLGMHMQLPKSYNGDKVIIGFKEK